MNHNYLEIVDKMICQYVMESKLQVILDTCHSSQFGGHYGDIIMAAKVLQSEYYWPTRHRDAHKLVKTCTQCQMQEWIFRRHEMSLKLKFELDLLNVWVIVFMGLFVSSYENKCILVADNYVSKWVDTIDLPNNEIKSVKFFLKKYILTIFGTA